MNNTAKKVLITGVNGFTGQYTWQEFLNNGYDVYGISQADINQKNIYTCCLEDKEKLTNIISEIKPDIIIHLAAIAHVGHISLHQFYETNVIGTENLLNAVYNSNINPQLVLLASSANIYGNNNSGKALHEEIVPHPENHYAISKLAMEQVAKWWIYKLPVIIVRPFNYTGIGQDTSFLLPKIVNHFKENKKEIELGNINIARDFSDVRVVAECYRKLAEKSKHMDLNSNLQIYNVCSGKTHYLKDAIEIMQKLAGYNIQIKVNPNFIRANEVKVLCGDNSKLISCVGEINPISLEETLESMYISLP